MHTCEQRQFTKDLDPAALPAVVDRATWQAELDALRVREKAHTHQGDALAAARRQLPMVQVDPTLQLVGPHGPVTLLSVFEGRRLLIVSFHMWHPNHPAQGQCAGCTFFNGQVRELSYLHARDVTYATFCEGPYEERVRYRDFMGWDVPWYSEQDAASALLAGRGFGMLVCYLRHGGNALVHEHGGTGQQHPEGEQLGCLADDPCGPPTGQRRTPSVRVALCHAGLLWLLHKLVDRAPLPNGTFAQAAWPETFPAGECCQPGTDATADSLRAGLSSADRGETPH